MDLTLVTIVQANKDALVTIVQANKDTHQNNTVSSLTCSSIGFLGTMRYVSQG
jgi:hypothetical protein